jgi:hypothetical protein
MTRRRRRRDHLAKGILLSRNTGRVFGRLCEPPQDFLTPCSLCQATCACVHPLREGERERGREGERERGGKNSNGSKRPRMPGWQDQTPHTLSTKLPTPMMTYMHVTYTHVKRSGGRQGAPQPAAAAARRSNRHRKASRQFTQRRIACAPPLRTNPPRSAPTPTAGGMALIPFLQQEWDERYSSGPKGLGPEGWCT